MNEKDEKLNKSVTLKSKIKSGKSYYKNRNDAYFEDFDNSQSIAEDDDSIEDLNLPGSPGNHGHGES